MKKTASVLPSDANFFSHVHIKSNSSNATLSLNCEASNTEKIRCANSTSGPLVMSFFLENKSEKAYFVCVAYQETWYMLLP